MFIKVRTTDGDKRISLTTICDYYADPDNPTTTIFATQQGLIVADITADAVDKILRAKGYLVN